MNRKFFEQILRESDSQSGVLDIFKNYPESEKNFLISEYSSDNFYYISPLTFEAFTFMCSDKVGGFSSPWKDILIKQTRDKKVIPPEENWPSVVKTKGFVLLYNKHQNSENKESNKYLASTGRDSLIIYDMYGDYEKVNEDNDYDMSMVLDIAITDINVFKDDSFDLIFEAAENGRRAIQYSKLLSEGFDGNLVVSTSRVKDSMYENNPLIKTLVIGPEVKEIGWGAFSDCSNLKEVHIQNTKKIIVEGSAFSGCKRLKKVVVDNEIDITDGFPDCTSLEEFIYNGDTDINLSDNFTSCVSLKNIDINFFIDKEENSIRWRSLAYTGVEEIVIPENVEKICEEAFLNCKSLRKVKVLGNNLKVIMNEAFKGCENLVEFDVPSSLRLIGFDAFNGCKNLKALNTENVVYLGAEAFEGCDNLKVALKDNVFIDSQKRAYGGDENFLNETENRFSKETNEKYLPGFTPQCISEDGQSLIIPEGIRVFEKNMNQAPAFRYVRNVKIPSSVKELSDRSFYCTYLEYVIFDENSVIKIGEEAFGSCQKLKSIKFPKSLKEIGDGVFYEAYGLESVVIPDNTIKKIPYKTFYDTKIKEFAIPNGVEEIRGYAFYKCKNLEKVYIPKSVKRIFSGQDFDEISEVIYEGSKEEFNEIEFEYKSDKENLISSEKIKYLNK